MPSGRWQTRGVGTKDGKDGTRSLLQSLADEVSENIKKEESKKNKVVGRRLLYNHNYKRIPN